ILADDKPVWLLCPPFCRVAASPYPAYERQQYQTLMRLAVGPRKHSAAGQSLHIALCLQSECLLHRGKAFLLLAAVAAAQGFDQGNVG
ncbi:hypothetical protein WAJ64_22040, partial [Acinetobacter baumannii]